MNLLKQKTTLSHKKVCKSELLCVEESPVVQFEFRDHHEGHEGKGHEGCLQSSAKVPGKHGEAVFISSLNPAQARVTSDALRDADVPGDLPEGR
mgnify:CR=1 FL=1